MREVQAKTPVLQPQDGRWRPWLSEGAAAIPSPCETSCTQTNHHSPAPPRAASSAAATPPANTAPPSPSGWHPSGSSALSARRQPAAASAGVSGSKKGVVQSQYSAGAGLCTAAYCRSCAFTPSTTCWYLQVGAAREQGPLSRQHDWVGLLPMGPAPIAQQTLSTRLQMRPPALTGTAPSRPAPAAAAGAG